MSDNLTINQAIEEYLKSVESSRSANTVRTYRNGLENFKRALRIRRIKTDTTQIGQLSEDSVAWFAEFLKSESPATERLYLSAVSSFFEFLAAENMLDVNLPRVRLLIRQRGRRPGIRLPQFPKSDIDMVLEYAGKLQSAAAEDEAERLRNLRDRAFLLTLADTGLRVHEACRMRRGDLDWNEGRAIIIGKGNKEAVVRFSRRAQKAIKDYLFERGKADGSSGKPLASLPLFARHDRGAGDKIKAITTTTGRNIVSARVIECLGPEASGSITPHSFRHYFVTRVLASSGNLKLAQELARHSNIAVTQRYAHLSNDELDQGYWNSIEEEKKNPPD